MREISDAFLLSVAQISATLLGLLVLGMFFYVETGLRRLEHAGEVFPPYIRAAARLTMVMYVVALATALSVVALELAWARAVFGVTSVAVVVSLVGYTKRARAMGRVMGSSSWSVPQEIITWTAILAVLAIPWILGVLRPSRGDLAWGILLTLLAGASQHAEHPAVGVRHRPVRARLPEPDRAVGPTTGPDVSPVEEPRSRCPRGSRGSRASARPGRRTSRSGRCSRPSPSPSPTAPRRRRPRVPRRRAGSPRGRPRRGRV